MISWAYVLIWYSCGDCGVARAESLIQGGEEALFVENGVVFSRNVRWIIFRLGGDADNLKMRVLLDKRFNPAKSLLFGKRYTLWQIHRLGMSLISKSMFLL